MKKCIIPGSYDPITVGHTQLFKTASLIFDTVYPVILVNTSKSGGMFTIESRFEFLKAAVDSLKSCGFSNIEPITYCGLTTDCATELGAEFIVKGVRNPADFSYEYDLAQISKRFSPSLKTIFVPSEPEFACVSSTYVRELIKYDRPIIKDFAPGTMDLIFETYRSNKLNSK